MIKVRYPFVVEDQDRHGNVRLYFRRRGRPKIRIHAQPGTADFDAAYRQLMEQSEAPKQPAENRFTVRSGTWRWLCVQYFSSALFKALDARTQHVRQAILQSTWAEPCVPGKPETYGGCGLRDLTEHAIAILRDRKGGTPEAANGRVKAVRQVFKWAKDNKLVSSNPARDVAYIRTSSPGHHSWTLAEVEQFEERHPIGSKARLALALLLLTGVRRSDVVRIGRQHVRDGWLKFTQHKNRNRRPVVIEIPILDELQRIIDQSPTGDMTFLVTEFGKPYTTEGFGNWFRRRCNEAGLPHCSAHGLRKAGAARWAEAGASEHHLMAWFGWLTAKEAERYTKAASRKKMAGALPQLLRNKNSA